MWLLYYLCLYLPTFSIEDGILFHWSDGQTLEHDLPALHFQSQLTTLFLVLHLSLASFLQFLKCAVLVPALEPWHMLFPLPYTLSSLPSYIVKFFFLGNLASSLLQGSSKNLEPSSKILGNLAFHTDYSTICFCNTLYLSFVALFSYVYLFAHYMMSSPQDGRLLEGRTVSVRLISGVCQRLMLSSGSSLWICSETLWSLHSVLT